jgi:outer membrane receptor protein involved in Fe transport
MKKHMLGKSIQLALVVSSAAILHYSPTSIAQQSNAEDLVEKIQVTGTRIRSANALSSSPILTIGEQEIEFQQQVEIERVLRNLPATIPGDNANVNNGTGGAATVNLRGLGTNRNLVLMDGKRMVPFNTTGSVDTSTIPTALIKSIDIVTGGASAVYGSDAISGAVNIILKDDFEGVELNVNHNRSEEGDALSDSIALTVGGNFDGGRGNAVVSVSWLDRDGLLLGDRALGQFGIDTGSGGNYQNFLDGATPSPPSDPGCTGENVVAVGGGSPNGIPTIIALSGVPSVSGQFRDDRSLVFGPLSARCSDFNFNPFNFYQTPSNRYSATAKAQYEVHENANVYTTINFTNTSVTQQVAPSGLFGNPFFVPLANPFLGANAQAIIDSTNAAVNAQLDSGNPSPLSDRNFIDANGNGIVDSEDSVLLTIRRRTTELGPRSTSFNTDQFQFVTGVEGFYGDWNYDVSAQYGETNRVNGFAGYSNVDNIGKALNSTDGVTCRGGDSTCVPIDLFGGFGTITPEMAQYAQAVAFSRTQYEQRIFSASTNGPIDAVVSPWAENELAMSFGYEYRNEEASFDPDLCLQLAPSSCLGGAGGNSLPVGGGFSVNEWYFEGLLPILQDQPFANSLDLEFGYRYANYDTVGENDTWKLGLAYRPIDSLLLRIMDQRATRAPNVGELFAPVTSALNNATIDPCSDANSANIDANLRQLCISTGMTEAQVGRVANIASSQVNAFSGSNPDRLPEAEIADSLTVGLVFTPEIDGVNNFQVSLDYYDIEVDGYIGTTSAQEVLDGCYTFAD